MIVTLLDLFSRSRGIRVRVPGVAGCVPVRMQMRMLVSMYQIAMAVLMGVRMGMLVIML